MVYSNVNTFSSVTLPISLVKSVFSCVKNSGYSFLKVKPLWSLTFTTTPVAITGFARMLAKFYVKVTGLTRSTYPPVNSHNLLRPSILHSDPMIETRLIVTPLDFANNPTLS